jgi:hypothetical protein
MYNKYLNLKMKYINYKRKNIYGGSQEQKLLREKLDNFIDNKYNNILFGEEMSLDRIEENRKSYYVKPCITDYKYIPIIKCNNLIGLSNNYGTCWNISVQSIFFFQILPVIVFNII